MMNGDGIFDPQIIIRSNWKGYLEEFAIAVDVWEGAGLSLNDVKANVTRANSGGADWVEAWTINGPERLKSETPLTNFEAKYVACGEPTYEQVITYSRTKIN